MLSNFFLCINLSFSIQAQVIYLNSMNMRKEKPWILNPVVLFCPTVNSNKQFFEKGTLNYDLFTDSENIWRGGTKMKEDDKFMTAEEQKLLTSWSSYRERDA